MVNELRNVIYVFVYLSKNVKNKRFMCDVILRSISTQTGK